jgi:hypothetical protein
MPGKTVSDVPNVAPDDLAAYKSEIERLRTALETAERERDDAIALCKEQALRGGARAGAARLVQPTRRPPKGGRR